MLKIEISFVGLLWSLSKRFAALLLNLSLGLLSLRALLDLLLTDLLLTDLLETLLLRLRWTLFPDLAILLLVPSLSCFAVVGFRAEREDDLALALTLLLDLLERDLNFSSSYTALSPLFW